MAGKTGYEVAVTSLGCWQIGGCWSSGDETAVHKQAVNAYLDQGGNFLDTANVYGGDYGTDKFGWSEKTIREVLRASGGSAHRDDVLKCEVSETGKKPQAMTIC